MGYNFDRLSGRTKEMLGKATGNKMTELKGKAQRELADIRHKADHVFEDQAD